MEEIYQAVGGRTKDRMSLSDWLHWPIEEITNFVCLYFILPLLLLIYYWIYFQRLSSVSVILRLVITVKINLAPGIFKQLFYYDCPLNVRVILSLKTMMDGEQKIYNLPKFPELWFQVSNESKWVLRDRRRSDVSWSSSGFLSLLPETWSSSPATDCSGLTLAVTSTELSCFGWQNQMTINE